MGVVKIRFVDPNRPIGSGERRRSTEPTNGLVGAEGQYISSFIFISPQLIFQTIFYSLPGFLLQTSK
jgi:hypothetical protein